MGEALSRRAYILVRQIGIAFVRGEISTFPDAGSCHFAERKVGGRYAFTTDLPEEDDRRRHRDHRNLNMRKSAKRSDQGERVPQVKKRTQPASRGRERLTLDPVGEQNEGGRQNH